MLLTVFQFYTAVQVTSEAIIIVWTVFRDYLFVMDKAMRCIRCVYQA